MRLKHRDRPDADRDASKTGAAVEEGPPRPLAVAILVSAPLPRPFDYRVPAELCASECSGNGATAIPLPVGTVVTVPLGRREVVGVVWGPASADVPADRLRDIIETHDVPPITDELRSLIDWVAAYSMVPAGSVLKMTVRGPATLEPPRPETLYAFDGQGVGPQGADDDAGPPRLTPARRRVLSVAGDCPPMTAKDLAREAGVGVGVVKGLAQRGLLRPVVRRPLPRIDLPPDDRPPPPELSEDQRRAAGALVAAVRDRGFQTFVLDGVTGSGKTETYFEAVAAALDAGLQVLVLLPEIALSAEWLQRFQQRFGFEPCVWHSDVQAGRRRETWRAVATGLASVVVGARSALFLPFRKLGLIVVDEEHDGAFKQEDSVVYNARDMAVVRAKLAEIPAVLASATPSLETLGNARAGRYRHLVLPDRHGGAVLPTVAALDLRRDMPLRGRFLAPSAVEAIRRTLENGEQAMLFLNRRGYAPLTLCRNCGHRLECPNCTAWLVDHRLSGRLQCHHCGHASRPVPKCTQCHAEDSFVACGPGVERIAEEVGDLFPEARAALMASDLVHTAAQAAEMVARIQRHEVDIVIGTQLVAKGHNFPLLSLVVVVDADLGFEGSDFRAFERTYQLLSQVGGRSGRADRSGRVLLQTRSPDHPVIAALSAGERDAFLDDLLEERQRHRLPPYSRMAAVIVSGTDAGVVDGVATALGRTAPTGNPAVSVVGPAPAPLALLRGRHRRRLLVTADRTVAIQSVLAQWFEKVTIPSAVRIQIDIDPYSFL